MTPQLHRNSQIDIMTNVQTDKLGAGIHSDALGFCSGGFSTNLNLSDFHTYSIEWNKSEIKWFCDNYNYLSMDINKNSNKTYFCNSQAFDQPLRIVLQLGLGSHGMGYFLNSKPLSQVGMDWINPIFMIDYVKVYEWNERHENR